MAVFMSEYLLFEFFSLARSLLQTKNLKLDKKSYKNQQYYPEPVVTVPIKIMRMIFLITKVVKRLIHV